MKNYKKFQIILIAFLCFMFLCLYALMPALSRNAEIKAQSGKEVVHFFTHQLIRDKDVAFASPRYKHYFEHDLLTSEEFKNFLEEVYKSGFVLVDINDVVIDAGGVYRLCGNIDCGDKKPMLLSFDDMSFDLIGKGLCDKLIVDDNGKIASYTESAEPKIEYDKEGIPILENFIAAHPDFSFMGARATICVTGYNGILGYRTQEGSYKNRETEIAEAKKVVAALKNLGYKFGCHTFNHIKVNSTSAWNLKKDLERFENEVEPLIGKTNIFCFPYGAKSLDEAHLAVLKNFGYNILFCIDNKAGTTTVGDFVVLTRMVIDRGNLKECYNEYSKYFDPNKVLT